MVNLIWKVTSPSILTPNIRQIWSKTKLLRLLFSSRLLNNYRAIDYLLPIDLGGYFYKYNWYRVRSRAFPCASTWTKASSGKSAASPQQRSPLFYVYLWGISTRYYNLKSSYWRGRIQPPYWKSHYHIRVDSGPHHFQWSIAGRY